MARSKEELIRFANNEILGAGNLGAIAGVFSAEYVVHAGGKDHRGHAFVEKFARLLRKAIPDVRVAEVAILLEAGDTVAWERTLTGTHEASLRGIPPSGRKVEWRDMVVTRFDGEKIAEEWSVSDLAGQLLLKLPPA